MSKELVRKYENRVLAKSHLVNILTDTRLLLEYGKLLVGSGSFRGLYYLVVEVYNEIENLDREIKAIEQEMGRGEK